MRLLRSATFLTSTAAALLTGSGSAHHVALPPLWPGPLRVAALTMSTGKRAARRQRRSTEGSRKPHVGGASARSAASSAKGLTVAPVLNPNHVPADIDELTKLAADYGKLRQSRKLVALYDTLPPESIAPSVSVTPIVRALVKANRLDLATELLRRHMQSHGDTTPTRSVRVVFLSLCRKGHLEEAYELLQELEELLSSSEDDRYVAELASASAPPPTEAAAASDVEVMAGAEAAAEAAAEEAAEAAAAAAEEAGDEPLAMAVETTLLPALARAQLERGEADAATALMERLSHGVAFPPLEKVTKVRSRVGARALGVERWLTRPILCPTHAAEPHTLPS